MKVLRLARGTWDVLLLADDQGRCEVLETINGLTERGGRGMLALLRDFVAQSGPPRDNPNLCARVEGEIWEFRKGAVRLFWFYDEGRVVVGAHAYKKQGQKAPRRHIKTAKQARQEYLKAKLAGTLGFVDVARGERP